MDGTKKCPTCGVEKPLDQFPGRTNSYCKPCHNAYAREYRRKNPDVTQRAKAKYDASCTPERRAARNRTSMLWRFNLTGERWDAIFDGQDHRCAICRTNVPSGHGWHVDHDHACCPENGRSCGKCVRAILCSECNTGLGKFRDNPAVLRAAADYLERVRE